MSFAFYQQLFHLIYHNHYNSHYFTLSSPVGQLYKEWHRMSAFTSAP